MSTGENAHAAAAAEARRQQVLRQYPVDQRLSDQLDRLAKMAAQRFRVPIGMINLIQDTEQIAIGRYGTDLREMPREWSFCSQTMHEPSATIVPDAWQDPRFADSPLVAGPAHIRFYAGHPLRSPEGAALGSLCVIDTQPHPEPTRGGGDDLALLASAAMALLDRWRIEQHSADTQARQQSQIVHLERQFETLADAMPHLAWGAMPNGATDYFNRGWCIYTGQPAIVSHGSGWMQFLYPDDHQAVSTSWLLALTTGCAYEVEYRLRRHDGTFRWMIARGLPVRDHDGTILRWIGTCTDIHTQREDAERLDLLTRELSHRIKNIFAVIGGLVSLTVRRRPEFAEAGRDLQHRVLALGRAHNFVRPHGEGSARPVADFSIKGMLAALLLPYENRAAVRITIAGDDIAIDDRSATALALFFHELATNAAKFGALSAPDGQVSITISSAADDKEVALSWCEHGGPPVIAAVEQGFGASLIEMSITRQLGGTIDYDWRDEGLVLCARIPVSSMQR